MTEQTTATGESAPVEAVKRGPGRPPKINQAKADALVQEMLARPDEPVALPVMPEKPKTTMLPVKLLKNYRPKGEFNVVEAAPPPVPGVAFTHKHKGTDGQWVIDGQKLWAGTIVELPRDEVIALLNNMAESMDPDIGPDGKPRRNEAGDVIRKKSRFKFPLAERADPLPL